MCVRQGFIRAENPVFTHYLDFHIIWISRQDQNSFERFSSVLAALGPGENCIQTHSILEKHLGLDELALLIGPASRQLYKSIRFANLPMGSYETFAIWMRLKTILLRCTHQASVAIQAAWAFAFPLWISTHSSNGISRLFNCAVDSSANSVLGPKIAATSDRRHAESRCLSLRASRKGLVCVCLKSNFGWHA